MGFTRHHYTAFAAALCVPLMLGMSYAAVPLYDIFCRVTGYGGTTQRAVSAPAQASNLAGGRMITVRFDANRNRHMPWQFSAVSAPVAMNVGERGLAFYHARNLAARSITGTASFNVTPAEAGVYFSKIDCFCFTEQTLAPGQDIDLPVSFFVAPEILDDPMMDSVDTITLSYTFFETSK